MSIVASWSPFFQSRVRMRGRAYQLAGRVDLQTPSEDELVRAHVQGGQSAPYVVTIRREGRAATAECTCPSFAEGSYCKHIWATVLTLQQGGDEEDDAAATKGESGISAAELASLRIRAPKARKRDENEAPTRNVSSEPEWMGRLSLLRSPMTDDESRAAELLPQQRQLAYVVLPAASTRHGGLVVEVRQRTASTSASGWSKLKPLRLSTSQIETLPDPVDRELCALLLGASRVDDYAVTPGVRERSHGSFRLPTGARQPLLRRMIETGRCYLDRDEDGESSGTDPHVPMVWQEGDWRLWMVGYRDEQNQDLVAHVELRRNHEKLAIDEPFLVVPGAEGLVLWGDRDRPGHCAAAAFDDRGAARWVTQFRGDSRWRRDDGRVQPLRIPAGEIDRFLDRLYMLPDLPEIDLPEELTRVEQQIKPIPHLDLFTAQSKQAQGLHAGSSALKNQLLAQVWFAYSDQRVSPLQPGRFVSVDVNATPAEDGDEQPSDTDAPEDPDDSEVSGEPVDENAENNGEAEAEATAGRLIRRDHRAEREAYSLLSSLGLRQINSTNVDTLLLPSKVMPQAVAELTGHGWVVSADQQVLRRPGAPNLSVASGIDWFELRGTISYQRADGQTEEVSLPDILAAMRAGENMITLGDGSKGLLPEQWLQDHQMLTTLGKLQGDHLRFKSTQAALLDALLDEKQLVAVDDTFAQARQRLHEFKGVEPVDPPPDFLGTLRPYQREGLGWLAFLRWFGMGGVLADDMGLGKTIQVLAMLQAQAAEARAGNNGATSDPAETTGAVAATALPSLIVAPRSLIFNWIDEAQRFTPDIRAIAYTGSDREAMRDRFHDYDLVITSYGLLRRDIEALREQPFNYVVLDEAQAIKNPGSQAAKAARLLDARHRLALTGTPVENHIGDLWSIFEFLNPGMLGTSARFGELIRASAAAEPAPAGGSPGTNGEPAVSSLAQVAQALRPFILRRTKRQVLADLPDKTEQTIVCEMEPAQRKIYDDLKAYYRSSLLTQLDTGPGSSAARGEPAAAAGAGGSSNNAFMVLEALLRLRQAACHPGLIDDKRADAPSAKLEALLEMLGDVIDEGGKALVFSQFTSMLGLVRRKLEAQGIPYVYLDGQTRDRKRVVEEFQNDPNIPVFLISLKAGGFGLNLTAAEYVFILDPWWNPAVEAQAIDRTHRIGQTRRVFAYRMICQDTVEQRIIELQNRKRQLADAIVDEQGDLLKNLTREDLESLLS